jgi:hypothetical protein
MKLLFWSLLLANIGLFAYHQGHLEDFLPSGQEPSRLSRQINADKLKLIPVAELEKKTKSETPVCFEIGNFAIPDARRFEEQLAGLAPPAESERRELNETSTHMVLIPPQRNKEAADKKASELRALGVSDYFVLNEHPTLRWAISLGIFTNEEMARAHMAQLSQKGVRSARMVEYAMPVRKAAFRFKGLDEPARAGVEKLKSEFVGTQTRNCG